MSQDSEQGRTTFADEARRVLAKYPDLGPDGFVDMVDAVDGPDDFRPLSEDALAQVERAVCWLDMRPRARRVSRSTSSYEIKHAVERWHRATVDGDGYVSSGALILAAYILGFPVLRDGDGPNAFIGIARGSL